jgi:hypothetical protein
MAPLKVTIIATIGALVILGVVFELIRRKQLRERYALIWLLTGVVLLVLALWRNGLNTLAGWVGVKTYPPSVIFAAILFFVLVLLLHFSIVLSRLTDQNTTLAQRLALLETEAREREQAKTEDKDEKRD